MLRPVEVDVAQLAADDQWPVRLWSSFPPTGKVAGKCQDQQLEPAAGAVIPPHGAARLVVLFKGVEAGDFFLGGQDVRYEVDGEPGSIALPNRFLARSRPPATRSSPTPSKRPAPTSGTCYPGSMAGSWAGFDLHMHTTRADGTYSRTGVNRMAAERRQLHLVP